MLEEYLFAHTPNLFPLDTFSVFITDGEAATFVFLSCKFFWIDSLQEKRDCMFHFVVFSVICIVFIFDHSLIL